MSRAVVASAPPAVRSPFRAEHVAMALAATALTVLVVLRLASLLLASVTDDQDEACALAGIAAAQLAGDTG